MTLAVIIESVRTRKDRTLAVTLGTQELSPNNIAELIGMNGKVCAAYITEKETVPQEVIEQVDKADIDLPGKSQSQRIFAVLFVLFKQDPEGYENFDSYYHAKTEKIINHLKAKIK